MADDLSLALSLARAKLKPPIRRERSWPALVAAAAFAVSALGFATAAVMAPSVTLTPVVGSR